ncbi:hypothetical protein BDN70DRAFT_872648 [Pholiota conissans]|uniref:Uncharacterized protein n=1 Tax=Pholiota conissans TaxID=109636 RepID=A0A9P6D5W6_9AGAR|nr:hypothetical protein BDN70DRAFT_872648 [Pholiota conissans]
MYSGYGTTSPPLTNNPFISGGNPSARYPDLSTPPQPQQQQQWNAGSPMGGGFPAQQQQGIYQQQHAYTQQQTGYGQPQLAGVMGVGSTGGGGGYLSPGVQSYPSQGPTAPFQPSSSFGQQLAAHVSGSSYGYLNGQQQQQQQNPNAYNPAQQQLQNNPGYVAQFDPYSSLGQVLGDGNASSGNQGYNPGGGGGMQGMNMGSTMSSASGNSAASYGTSSNGNPHPKDYVRTHKAEVEAWDQYAWKQLMGAFEALMQAWEARKNELSQRVGELSQQMQAGMAYGQYYVMQIQQEGSRIQGVRAIYFSCCTAIPLFTTTMWISERCQHSDMSYAKNRTHSLIVLFSI